jgi:hypothetical protein
LLGRIEPIHAGHLEVEHDDIEFILIELRYRFPSIGRLAANLPVILRFEERPQTAAHHGIIVHYQNASHLRVMS